MWKLFAVGAVAAGVGIAIGASLPKIREELRKQKEEDEKKRAAAKLAEQVREDAREQKEIEEVAKMEPKAQVLYFERRRELLEEKKRKAAEDERRGKAVRGVGAILRAVAAWRGISWLTIFAEQLAEGVMDIFRWLTGGEKKEAPPSLVAEPTAA